jgi:selenophosphate synthetase-related protein
MKKILVILFIAFAFVSCKKEKYTDIIKTGFAEEMFVGKWYVSYADDGSILQVGNLLLINSDGTFAVVFSNYT